MSRKHQVRRRESSAAARAAAAEPDASWRLPVAVMIVAALPFAHVLSHQLLNWDDAIALVHNPHLAGPGVLPWAFSTTLLDHYQPFTWLAWASVVNTIGVRPWAIHALSLSGHALNAVLVYMLAMRVIGAAGSRRGRALAAFIAAVAFATHPMQAETVAWASAFPYVLALFFLLVSTLAYLEYCTRQTDRRHASWFVAAAACYAASLLSRPYAVLFAAVLLCLDVWVVRRDAPLPRLIVEKIPFALAAVAAVAVESHARTVSSLSELPIAARLELAVETPFRYAGRVILPLRLSPVYPLPVDGRVSWPTVALLAAVTACVVTIAVRSRRRAAVLCVLATSLLLVAPPLLAPSGLQASADRYLYFAAVPLAIGAGACCASAIARRPRLATAATVAIALGFTAATIRQVSFWRDSVSLWSRAVAIDRTNDIAAYNLAAALAEAGRRDEAIAWYERTLALVPDHAQARQNLTALQAARYEAEAASDATAGRFPEAIAGYTNVLRLDPARRGARAARGIAFARTEAWSDAASDLSAARQAGADDAEVANSLALALVHLGRDADAVRVLKETLRSAPGDLTIARNLARLLLDADDRSVRDATLAESLALQVCARTGNQDADALETLAAAYAATGKLDLARQAAARGVDVARDRGRADTAAALEEMLRRLGSSPARYSSGASSPAVASTVRR